ncbi:rhomboid family intramembrane serine protease [Candidatus Poribacteria bacterium]|nr:rhomboid family intramembrane serine protease [Candidatus Poribacteria bacterium]
MNHAYYGGGGFTRFARRGLLPPAIKLLLIANAGMYGLDFVLRAVAPELGIALFAPRVGLLPLQTNLDPDFARAFGLFRPWQLVTYMFLHANLFHIGFNMLALWMFGTEVEERWGTRHFATYYFLCGIGGGILQLVLPTLLHRTPNAVVGASGAVYGVLLAFGMMFPTRLIYIPVLFIPIGIPAKMLVIIYAVLSILGGLGGGGGVAHFAHLGGMAFGFAYIKWQQSKRRFYRG